MQVIDEGVRHLALEVDVDDRQLGLVLVGQPVSGLAGPGLSVSGTEGRASAFPQARRGPPFGVES